MFLYSVYGKGLDPFFYVRLRKIPFDIIKGAWDHQIVTFEYSNMTVIRLHI